MDGYGAVPAFYGHGSFNPNLVQVSIASYSEPRAGRGPLPYPQELPRQAGRQAAAAAAAAAEQNRTATQKSSWAHDSKCEDINLQC